MKKDRETAAGIFLIGAGITAAMVSYFEVRDRERAKRAEIEAKKNAELKAMWIASGVVKERIRSGTYRNIEEAMQAFEFETIIEFNE